MKYDEKYTALDREALMQAVQMRMSERRFKHVLGVEETAGLWQNALVAHLKRQVLQH